jgi:hypothetical protein
VPAKAFWYVAPTLPRFVSRHTRRGRSESPVLALWGERTLMMILCGERERRSRATGLMCSYRRYSRSKRHSIAGYGTRS